MFDIEISKPAAGLELLMLGQGAITIGTFSEAFEIDFSFWHADDYRRQWQEGVERTLVGHEKSCLLTSVSDPQRANFLMAWLLYRNAEAVYFQNRILFLDQLGCEFTLADPYRHMRCRETTTEAGQQVSEWSTDLKSLEAWLQKDCQ